MKKLKLCNVHKLAFANEGEGRKPIHIPFGTWAYDDTIDQTLDREHAEKIAAVIADEMAKVYGEEFHHAEAQRRGELANSTDAQGDEITQEQAEKIYEEMMAK